MTAAGHPGTAGWTLWDWSSCAPDCVASLSWTGSSSGTPLLSWSPLLKVSTGGLQPAPSRLILFTRRLGSLHLCRCPTPQVQEGSLKNRNINIKWICHSLSLTPGIYVLWLNLYSTVDYCYDLYAYFDIYVFRILTSVPIISPRSSKVYKISDTIYYWPVPRITVQLASL